jgi:hypothetical protein
VTITNVIGVKATKDVTVQVIEAESAKPSQGPSVEPTIDSSKEPMLEPTPSPSNQLETTMDPLKNQRLNPFKVHQINWR